VTVLGGRAWLRASIAEFRRTPVDAKLGQLARAWSATGHARLEQTQIHAWRRELDLLDEALATIEAHVPSAAAWTVLLEYEIPRRQRRIDAVILSEGMIAVVEFKVATDFTRAGVWQTLDYALDLRDFHAGSRGRPITPLLVATDAPPSVTTDSVRDGVHLIGREQLAERLLVLLTPHGVGATNPIDPAEWDRAGFSPTPTIIRAAEVLFAGQSIRELSHAYANNLTDTTDAIGRVIMCSERDRQRTICFVTGVPGAGKTLAGLAAVHDPTVRGGRETVAAFMSGNGPLVRILREALARDGAGHGQTKAAALRKARHVIQNVHAFIEEYSLTHPDAVPPEHVVVFDEAQRAWDASKLTKRHKTLTRSEPELVLDAMTRPPGWCNIVALIGGGQEIHTGEAGLEEWGRALAASPVSWHVVASPDVIHGGASVAHHRLFEGGVPSNVELSTVPAMHLDVSVRSPRAQRMAEWVNSVLDLDDQGAAAAARGFQGFPVCLTRSLATARQWLRDRSRQELRPGLLAASGNLRLRAYGLEMDPAFHQGVPIERWFLDGPEDVRSSYQLEVALTEFECQGLELDYVGLCWGDDFTVATDGGSWTDRRFSGSAWKTITDDRKQRYLMNKYRVLLTRAREGLVIWVPPGDLTDPTRPPAPLDRTARFLARCGAEDLD
jgi:hypothetical protein